MTSRPIQGRRFVAMELRSSVVLFLGLCSASAAPSEQIFRVCTYNVESYLDAPAGDRPIKSEPARAKVVESLLATQADVVALQEMGSPAMLQDLRTDLQARGLAFSHWEHVTSSDTNIHLAVLSRFPIVARRPHTNEAFALYGRRYRVSRGFAEVEIQVTPNYRFTLLTAHLKSKRMVEYGDQAELREEEARLLRRIINTKLTQNPQLNLVVLGDFNDTKESTAIRVVLGRGKAALFDTRPAESTRSNSKQGSQSDSRSVTWTYFFEKEDVYSRIDYLLLSKGMARELESSAIVCVPGWGLGSDHRPLVATFRAKDQ